MIKLRILSPEHGHQELVLEIAEAADYILEQKEKGKVGFVKFDDGQILEMMERTGILQQLEEHDDQQATIVPVVSGG